MGGSPKPDRGAQEDSNPIALQPSSRYSAIMNQPDGIPQANLFAATSHRMHLVFHLVAVAVMVSASPLLALAQSVSGESVAPATAAQIQSLLLDRVGFLVLGAIFLAIGVIVILLTLGRFEIRDGVLLLFGVMSLLWGLRFVCRAPAIPLVFGGDPATWGLFTRFLTYLSAPPAFGFVWRLFGPGWHSSLRILTWVSIVFAVLASVFLLVRPDPDLLIRAFNIMMLTGVVVIAANILRPEYRHHPELKKLIAGGLASLVFIILENLRSLDAVNISFDVEWVGVVILYGTLGYMAVSHIIHAERKLATLRQELATARQIQASILPQNPPVTPGLAIATRYLPMTEVAGDFFDFATVEDNRFGFLIADVSGHGVPAALVAAMVKVAFQAQVGHREGPARVLSGMNKMLGHRLHGQFVTAGYTCIDTTTGTMRYAGAGHPPLLLMSGHGGIENLDNNGLMLGPFPEAQYDSAERQLESGDRILMYTDGIVEAFNEKDEEFGDKRLKGLLSANASRSAEEFADLLLDEVRAWTGIGPGGSLDDDLTLIVIDVLP